MRKVIAVSLSVVLLGLIIAGCGQPQVSEEPLTGHGDEPLWVSKGIYAFPDEVGQAIGGVGIAERSRFPSLHLRKVSAEKRAREAVASQLRSLVQSVFKDYSEAAFTESMDEATGRQLTSMVQKSVVDEVLFDSQVRDIWTNPATQDYYAFVKLGMDGVAERIRSKMIELEKDRLRVDADKAHEDLDKIIEKYRNSPLQ